MVDDILIPALSWLKLYGNLAIPLLLSVWMAWWDLRARRIPNYLTFGTALAGLGFQAGLHGLPGLGDGLLGLVLGFALLILFYIKGGMGAGDVKALAALGAWLGPRNTFYLFINMALVGGLLSLIFLWWRGLLWAKIRKFWAFLINWVLLKPFRARQEAATQASDASSANLAEQNASPAPIPVTDSIPYAVALAAGMGLLVASGV